MDDANRQLCNATRQAIPQVSDGYDRETDLPMHLDQLLYYRALSGAPYELITHIQNTLSHHPEAGESAKRAIDMITAETRRRHEQRS